MHQRTQNETSSILGAGILCCPPGSRELARRVYLQTAAYSTSASHIDNRPRTAAISLGLTTRIGVTASKNGTMPLHQASARLVEDLCTKQIVLSTSSELRLRAVGTHILSVLLDYWLCLDTPWIWQRSCRPMCCITGCSGCMTS